MPKSIRGMDTGDPSYLGAYFLFMKNRTFPCPSPSANLVGIKGSQEEMSNILLLSISRYLWCPGTGKQTHLVFPTISLSNDPENKRFPSAVKFRQGISRFDRAVHLLDKQNYFTIYHALQVF